MASLLRRVRRGFNNVFGNAFNTAFYRFISAGFTRYDPNNTTYVDKGLLLNSFVYSISQQRAKKAQQVPYSIKRVKDTKARMSYVSLKQATKSLGGIQQQIRLKALSAEAHTDEYMPFPMERPNPLQTWGDIIGLYETFMSTTGNFYLYLYKGVLLKNPIHVYVLPAHLMEIVLKPNANMLSDESPIDHYRLIRGDTRVKFRCDDVIHVKLPNPDYDESGSHLYGLSPLRAVLRNIQSSNVGVDNNVKVQLNSGAFGFIHGKNVPLTQAQAASVKGKLLDMRGSTEELSHIAGSSAELGFTRISLTTDELKPFDYLKFDMKQIANALGWDDKLLNNDEGAKFSNVELAEQRVVVNTTMPSLQLFTEAMNDQFLPCFKGYENTVWEFDFSQLPEMQQDISQMVDWLTRFIDSGVMTREEVRNYISLPTLPDPYLSKLTVSGDILTLEEAVDNQFSVDNDPRSVQE